MKLDLHQMKLDLHLVKVELHPHIIINFIYERADEAGPSSGEGRASSEHYN